MSESPGEDFLKENGLIERTTTQRRKLLGCMSCQWLERSINGEAMKCDIIFLGSSIDNPNLLEKISIREDIDTVKYIPGTLLWAVDRKNITRSHLTKLIGTAIYKQMTVRNSNTLSKLAALME